MPMLNKYQKIEDIFNNYTSSGFSEKQAFIKCLDFTPYQRKEDGIDSPQDYKLELISEENSTFMNKKLFEILEDELTSTNNDSGKASLYRTTDYTDGVNNTGKSRFFVLIQDNGSHKQGLYHKAEDETITYIPSGSSLSNEAVLNKFGEDANGKPTYNGNPIDTTIAQRDVYDGLDSTDNTISLAASQGKVLDDKITTVDNKVTTVDNKVTTVDNKVTTLSGNTYTKTEADNKFATKTSQLDITPKATDPSAMDDGSPLKEGANYYNTTDKSIKTYVGGVWEETKGGSGNTGSVFDSDNVPVGSVICNTTEIMKPIRMAVTNDDWNTTIDITKPTTTPSCKGLRPFFMKSPCGLGVLWVHLYANYDSYRLNEPSSPDMAGGVVGNWTTGSDTTIKYKIFGMVAGAKIELFVACCDASGSVKYKLNSGTEQTISHSNTCNNGSTNASKIIDMGEGDVLEIYDYVASNPGGKSNPLCDVGFYINADYLFETVTTSSEKE